MLDADELLVVPKIDAVADKRLLSSLIAEIAELVLEFVTT